MNRWPRVGHWLPFYPPHCRPIEVKLSSHVGDALDLSNILATMVSIFAGRGIKITVAESRRGWVTVAGTFLILLLGFGSAYSFGAFFTPLQHEFGASRAAVSVAFSAAILLLFSVGPFSGTLADRMGPRVLVAGGTALVGLGLIGASVAQAMWQVQLCFAVGIGGGVGLAYVPSVGVVQKWFDLRRGLASGIAVSGIGAGTLLVPPFAALAIAEMEWRPALLLVGAIVFIAGGLGGLLVTSPPSEDKSVDSRAADQPGTPMASAIRSRPFLLLFLGFLLASFGQFTPIAHLVPYAEDRGISPREAATLLSLLGVGSAVGRFAIGSAADRIGRWRGLGLSFAGVGASCVLWLIGDGMVVLGIFAVLVGTFWGGGVALAPSVMADYFGTRAVSGIIGVLYAGVGFGALVGPVVAGLVFDLWQSYVIAIAYSITAPVIAGALVLSAESPERWRLRAAGKDEPGVQNSGQRADYSD